MNSAKDPAHNGIVRHATAREPARVCGKINMEAAATGLPMVRPCFFAFPTIRSANRPQSRSICLTRLASSPWCWGWWHRAMSICRDCRPRHVVTFQRLPVGRGGVNISCQPPLTSSLMPTRAAAPLLPAELYSTERTDTVLCVTADVSTPMRRPGILAPAHRRPGHRWQRDAR